MRTPRFGHESAAVVAFALAVTSGQACRLDADGMRGDPAVARPGLDPDETPPRARDARSDQAAPRDAAGPEDPAVVADAGASDDAAVAVSPPVAEDALSQPAAEAGPAADAGLPAVAPPAPPARCTSPRPRSVAVRRLGKGPTSDDITFDLEGQLTSFDRRDLVRVSSDGQIELLARNVIGPRGGALRMVPSGDLFLGDFARDAVLVRRPDGQLRTLPTPVSGPMKMVQGPSARLYLTGKDGTIYRVDARTGATSAAARTAFKLGGLTFSLDYQTLYVAATNSGALYAFDVRADGSLAPPRLWREQIADVSALATDECGSVYVLSENDGRVRRISASGGVEVLANLNEPFLWSLAFGSGKHGWSDQALYILEAEAGRMFELAVGVAGQPAPGDGGN